MVGALAAAAVWVTTGTAAAATLSASVTVNASQSLGTFTDIGVGANTAVWDSNLADTQTATLMRNANVKMLRYPGGSYADIYHWQTHTADGGAFIAPNTSFDSFMGMVRSASSQAMVIANYGSGTAQEAADWVRSANVTKGYGVKYWEIGNEVYGNGHYGSQWENDTHADKSPRAYATNALQYITAMKAVDPSIKIGIVLTTPGGWPDGVVGSGDSADWNNTVMGIIGNRADFAIFHFYPGGASEADMLTKAGTVAGTVSPFRALLNRYGATNTQIMVTETNGAPKRTTQPDALYAADLYLTMMENGVTNIDWWNTHNGAGTIGTDSAGATDYGDEGMISNGSCSGGTCEPAAQTPFAPYFGIQMVSRVGGPGAGLIGTSSSASLLTTHAAKRADGSVDVLLLNKDPNNSYSVNLSYSGFTPAASVTVDTFARGTSAITSGTQGTSTSQTIPPYALVTVHLRAGSGPTSGPTTAAPSPSASTPRPSTSPAPGGTCRVAYRTNSWSTGFTADVTITNAGSTAINGWNLQWTFPGNQQITSAWNGVSTQNGQSASVANASYNATIAPNGSASFGFQASYSGTNADPTDFRLGGTACTRV
jgi:hypothetical protein